MSDQEVKVRIVADASGATQGFNQLSSSMKKVESESVNLASRIKTHWLGITAAVAGFAIGTTQAWNLIKQGAEYSEQQGLLDNLSRKYSTTAESLVRSMSSAADGMIANSDLMQTALSGISKGLRPEQLINLADAARIMSDMAGGDATTALNDLTRALVTGRERGMVEYTGKTISLSAAFDGLESKMSDAEKMQAMYLLIMIRNVEWQKEQTKAVDESADKIERMEAKWNNLVTTVATTSKTLAVSVDDWLGKYIFGPLESLDQALKDKFSGKVTMDAIPMPAASKPDKLSEMKKELDLLRETLKVRAGSDEAARKASKHLADEKKLQEEKYRLELTIAREVTASEDAMMKDIEEGTKKTLDSIKNFYKDRGEAARELYKDMRGYEGEYYEESVKLIEENAKRYRELGLEEIAIAKYVEEQKRLARLQAQRTGTGGTFAEGWRQGADDLVKDLGNNFSRAEAMAKTTAGSMSRTFSDVFFDAAKGDMKDFRTYWESFMDAILRKVTDTLADMLVSWLATTAKMAASSSGGSAGLVKGIIGLVGSVAGAFAGAAGVTAGESMTAFNSTMYHGGGIVGGDMAPSRRMPAYAWAGAPRFHGGFMPGEYPAILKRGEGVFTPGQMAALGKSGGTTNVNIYAWDSRSLEDYVKRNAGVFQNINTQGLRDNKTRSEWKKLLN